MLNTFLKNWSEKYRASRAPDVIIGGDRDPPYIKRWWVIPRNRFFNIYLHEIGQDDDDRALHDHPWINFSYLIDGSYIEHTIERGGVNKKTRRDAGGFKFRFATAAHRLELVGTRTISLFITGPKVRKWGFHCPQGWRRWEEFVDNRVREDGTVVSNRGKGCD